MEVIGQRLTTAFMDVSGWRPPQQTALRKIPALVKRAEQLRDLAPMMPE